MDSSPRTHAAVSYCQRHGLPAPMLLRAASGTSLYRSGDRVIRIAAPGRSAMTGERQITAARLLAEHGVRTATCLAPLELTDDGEELTVWGFLPHDPELPYASAGLGEQLRALHDIPVATADAVLGPVPRLDDEVARGRARVEIMETLGPGETGIRSGELIALFDELEARSTDAFRANQQTLLHGDMNPGNVLRSAEQDPYLIDLERLTVGPWVWDLVNTQRLIAGATTGPRLKVDPSDQR